jgi:hypothetical protein
MAGGRPSVKASCGNGLTGLRYPRMSKGDEERARRLAEALRQNLRRRKAQARETAEKPQQTEQDSKEK